MGEAEARRHAGDHRGLLARARAQAVIDRQHRQSSVAPPSTRQRAKR